MYTISFTKKAKKFFDKLPKQDASAVAHKLQEIKQNPFPYLKKLHGPFWRLRVMNYRLILDVIISGKKIIVLKIGHRKNVYDK